jgi:XRE family transcriptional regulator, regulator of sulfur utilization
MLEENNKKHLFYIGTTLKKLRKKESISQETLADYSKINRSHLSRIEQNRSHPELETVFKLAIGLNMPVEELVKAINEDVNFKKVFDDLPEK